MLCGAAELLGAPGLASLPRAAERLQRLQARSAALSGLLVSRDERRVVLAEPVFLGPLPVEPPQPHSPSARLLSPPLLPTLSPLLPPLQHCPSARLLSLPPKASAHALASSPVARSSTLSAILLCTVPHGSILDSNHSPLVQNTCLFGWDSGLCRGCRREAGSWSPALTQAAEPPGGIAGKSQVEGRARALSWAEAC